MRRTKREVGRKKDKKTDEKCHCGRMDGKHVEGSMERLSSVTAQEDARRNVGKERKKKTRQGREDIIRLILTKMNDWGKVR